MLMSTQGSLAVFLSLLRRMFPCSSSDVSSMASPSVFAQLRFPFISLSSLPRLSEEGSSGCNSGLSPGVLPSCFSSATDVVSSTALLPSDFLGASR